MLFDLSPVHPLKMALEATRLQNRSTELWKKVKVKDVSIDEMLPALKKAMVQQMSKLEYFVLKVKLQLLDIMYSLHQKKKERCELLASVN